VSGNLSDTIISNCFKQTKLIESDLEENFDDNYFVVFDEFVKKE